MKHIVKVTLHNYRGWAHEEIYFTKGLNVIWGEGGTGKSALEKALRWATANETQSNFINTSIKTPGKKIKANEEVYVSIEYSTGEIVCRLANASSYHYYYLGDTSTPREEWIEYEKVNKDIPPEIIAVTNMNDLNIEKQFDSFFLLHLNGSAVAKELNKMVNLEIIDTSRKKINSIVSSIKREKDIHTTNVASLGEELDSYDFLEQMLIDIDALELTEKMYEEVKEAITKVKNSLDQIERITKDSIEYVKKASMRTLYETVTALLSKVELVSHGVKEISSMALELAQVEELALNANAIVGFKKSATNITEVKKNFIEKTAHYNEVIDLYKAWENVQHMNVASLKESVTFKKIAQSVHDMSGVYMKQEKAYNDICDCLDKYSLLDEDKSKVGAEVKELREKIGEVCPTCGKPWQD